MKYGIAFYLEDVNDTIKKNQNHVDFRMRYRAVFTKRCKCHLVLANTIPS